MKDNFTQKKFEDFEIYSASLQALGNYYIYFLIILF